jgi:alpha-galactosidase
LRARVRPSEGSPVEVSLPEPGSYDVGPVRIEVSGTESELQWSVHARGQAPVALDAVGLVWELGSPGDDPRLFVNGYQSWAPTRTMRLGVDRDPSHDPRPLPLVRAAFHADPGVARAGELRSEQVTLVACGAAPRRCVGFAGGERHAGTLRVRIVDDIVELCAEAWLGGALVHADAPRALHAVVIDEDDDASALLERWARRVGAAAGARTSAPYIVGWCSWYQYFNDVDERAVRDNLARADAWPFDVFQVDDGYQRAIGDWLDTNERFPSGVAGIADLIAASGGTPGLWLAPFLAAPDSELARQHPEWLVRAPTGDGFAIGMYNDAWGGVMATLDTTRPEVLDHLSATAAALVEAGYRYLKLDFTFSPAMPGRASDPTRTPAERVRAGFDAVRRGAGDDVLIVGCGAPLGAVVGSVDAMRIGADVAPWWDAPAGTGEQQPGYETSTPSTRNAFVNTCTRSFMHRRLWSNDPDCVMLRKGTQLPASIAKAWAETVGCSGGLVLVSDDLTRLGPDARRLLDDVVSLGRSADAAALAGRTPRCDALLDPAGPTGLRGPAGDVRVDPVTGAGGLV